MGIYEKEFKERATKLAQEIGVSNACRELDIPNSTLAGWVRNYKKYNETAFVGKGNKRVDSSNLEVKRLEKENRELKMANETLKKAIVFLAESKSI